MTVDPRGTTRRTLLTTSGAVALFGVAGCLGDEDDGAENGDENGEENGDENGEEANGDDDHDDDHDHVDIETFDVVDRDTDEVAVDVHDDHWHGDPLLVPEDDTLSLEAHVEDDHGDEIPLGDDEEYTLNARLADDAQQIVEIESHGDHLHITGEETGITDVVFQLWHGDHADWESPELETEVVEDPDEHDDHDDEDHDHDDDHDDDNHDDDH